MAAQAARVASHGQTVSRSLATCRSMRRSLEPNARAKRAGQTRRKVARARGQGKPRAGAHDARGQHDAETVKRFAEAEIADDAAVTSDGHKGDSAKSLGARKHDAIVQTKAERAEADTLAARRAGRSRGSYAGCSARTPARSARNTCTPISTSPPFGTIDAAPRASAASLRAPSRTWSRQCRSPCARSSTTPFAAAGLGQVRRHEP